MKDFPQELVDQVIDELFALVGTGNCYQGSPSKLRRALTSDADGISNYSLVSKAWVDSTQKHHFNTLPVDGYSSEKWGKHIAPDPAGVSRHVRKLVLDGLDPVDLEGFENHMGAFTQVEYLTVVDCDDILQGPYIIGWSSLIELRIHDSPATSHTVASLLAALPLLQRVEIRNFGSPGGLDEDEDEDEAGPSQIPFFESANRFTLRSDYGHSYPEGSFDWIPPSARFSRLELDTACPLQYPDLVNRWLASSRTTLTDLTIRHDPEGVSRPTQPARYCFVLLTVFFFFLASIPDEPISLDLSRCTVLESLRVPVYPFAGALLSHVTSSQLAKVTLELRRDEPILVGDGVWDVIEQRLCPLARMFNDGRPGRKMEVQITGRFGDRYNRTDLRLRKALNEDGFMSKLKEVAVVLVPRV